MKFMALNTKITTKVSSDHEVSNTLPLCRAIELLIDVAIESEGRHPYLSLERQITEALFERLELTHLAVGLNHHRRPYVPDGPQNTTA